MNLSNSVLCINCDTIFSMKRDDHGDYGYLANRYKGQCPSCGSTTFMPLANIIIPIASQKINDRNVSQ